MASRRGFGSSQPNTAPPKSSLRSRGPVSEANPTLALTPETRSAIALILALILVRAALVSSGDDEVRSIARS